LAAGFVQKFVELSPIDLLKAQADEFGEAAIGGTNFSVERKRDQDIVGTNRSSRDIPAANR